MTPDFEYWDRLQALFHLAEESPNADLDQLLAIACDDPELRQRAKALVETGRRTAAAGALIGAPTLPRKIGSYTVLRYLGSGGIGTVYLVERVAGGAVQRAALKTLTRSAAGSLFTERFAREQHILSSLDHPNITRMLDAGLSEDGQPYLVMEYVDGVHLDAYCDERSLGVPERLQLFLQVCEAIAYAHRNLIVHLDLKPSNVLVTASEGTVKVLDFGTSKLIQSDSLLATTVMATPAYASPEQLLNEPVTTVCDVYALGAILFELLSGRRPNQDSGVALLIERSMKEFPPEPVTQAVAPRAAELRGLTQTRLRSLLSGDLATIIAKCLNPRPKDRYSTVDALVADLRRYQAGRPVLARPQTTTYRLGKFVRRNRTAVVVGLVATLALIGTGSYAFWRQEQAFRSAQRAVYMQTFMYRLFRIANTYYTGKPTETVSDFLRLGVKVLPDFIKDPRDLRAARLSLAESMYDNSDYKGAQPVLRQVIASAKEADDLPSEAEAESFAGDIEYTIGNADTGYALTSHALSLANRPGVSPSARVRIKVFYATNREETSYRSEENLQMMRSAIAEAQTKHLPEREVATAKAALADGLEERGRLDEASSLYREILKIYDSESYATCDEADIHKKLGVIQGQRKDYAGALPLYQQAYQESSRCAGPEDLQTLSSQGYLAGAMLKVGQTKQAIDMLEKALPTWTKVVGPDSSHMATPLIFLSRAYLQDGQFTAAERTILRAIQVNGGKQKPLSALMGAYYLILTKALMGQGKKREALADARHAEAAFAAENSKVPSLVDQAKEAHRIALELASNP
jgi:eukaryotic-like serine/threonine-protein kinase